MTPLARTLSIGFGVLLALTAGCAEPFDTPPAYEELRYLCDPADADAWQELVDQCRAGFDRDGSCAGVVSFAGTLEDQPVVVEAFLVGTTFDDSQRLDSSMLRDRITTIGYSPYFQFVIDYKDVGGDVNMGNVERSLSFGADPNPQDDELLDEYVVASLRITNAGRSEDLRALTGAVSFTTQLPREQAGSFVGAFGAPDDYIDGCFHLFATETIVSQETMP